MQVNLGDKIRALRKRDGRKQEDLAKALGVTAQAISRWEANGGYPDMSMIPAIANYFHITIDELFGYNNVREEKINECVVKANKLLLSDDEKDLMDCINMLREGLEEFPSEKELQYYLAHALNKRGTKESDKANAYWQEAVSLYENISRDHGNVVCSLLSLYSQMGEYEKAENRAMKQPPIQECKEVLLASVFNDKKGELYRGEAILSLLHTLSVSLENAIAKNGVLSQNQDGIDIICLLRELYEKLLGKDFCGSYHSDLVLLDLRCTKVAANMKDYEKALGFFDSAYDEFLMCESRFNSGQCEEDHYNSPLFTEVANVHSPMFYWTAEGLIKFLAVIPKELRTLIKKNKKYKEFY